VRVHFLQVTLIITTKLLLMQFFTHTGLIHFSSRGDAAAAACTWRRAPGCVAAEAG
jgi:hypothetical protein